jgi:hypothetical protein
MTPGVFYINRTSSPATYTLPTTAALGTLIRLTGGGVNGWTIAQNSGQSINSTAHSTTTGTGGSLTSGGNYDSVDLICTVANTSWTVLNSCGTLTFH